MKAYRRNSRPPPDEWLELGSDAVLVDLGDLTLPAEYVRAALIKAVRSCKGREISYAPGWPRDREVAEAAFRHPNFPFEEAVEDCRREQYVFKAGAKRAIVAMWDNPMLDMAVLLKPNLTETILWWVLLRGTSEDLVRHYIQRFRVTLISRTATAKFGSAWRNAGEKIRSNQEMMVDLLLFDDWIRDRHPGEEVDTLSTEVRAAIERLILPETIEVAKRVGCLPKKMTPNRRRR